MFKLESFDAVADELRSAYIAVGNFDGVHRGHEALIRRLRTLADAARSPAIALTFDPRPVDVLRPGAAPPPLSWLERKVALLRQAGATRVGVFQTGAWLLGLTAREFFETVVLGQFGARGMVEGPTFGFGRDRGGDAALLGRWCSEAGLEFEIVPPLEIGGGLVSSSRIRGALAQGRVADAARWIGRPHRLRGTVARGAGRGAPLGLPTANLASIDVLIPADGVYAGRAYFDGRVYGAAIHVGPNVTFGETARSVEAHLLDVELDLYGAAMELEFVERVRPTERFSSVEMLKRQIEKDVLTTRGILEACAF